MKPLLTPPEAVPRGCRDIPLSLAHRRRTLLNAFAAHVSRYAFHEIETPILEYLSLYTPLGPTSDVFSNEMYHLANTTPPLVLRPEGTAGVARAHPLPGRVWYAGPMFRRERPQRGRFRQFAQLGVENLGDACVSADAELIEMAHGYLRHAGVDPVLRLNTLGTRHDRARFNDALRDFLAPRSAALSALSKRRLETGNVMRVLDSKLEADRAAMRGAPSLRDFVTETERERFEHVQRLLTEAGVAFRVDDTLVRGLDYYTSTAFEFDGPCGRAVCAGGRYDDLVGASGVGFAIGLDRIEGPAGAFEELSGAVVVVGLDERAERADNEVGSIVRGLVRGLRSRGCRALAHVGNVRLAKSVAKAVKAGAAVVVVVGDTEAAGGFATVKFVQKEGEEQPVRVPLSDIFDVVCGRVHSESDFVKLEAPSM